MRVFITGSTGFLGDHVSRMLTSQGVDIVRLVRTPDMSDMSDMSDTSVVCNSVEDFDPVNSCVKVVDAVVHLAGLVHHTHDPRLVSDMRRVNVRGTMAMMKAARHWGCPIICASTSGVSACFESSNASVGDASTPYATNTIEHMPYYLTKLDAERSAISYADTHDIDLRVVRFPTLIGPGERGLRSNRVLDSFRRGSYPCYLNVGLSFVDVRDVARTMTELCISAIDGLGVSETRDRITIVSTTNCTMVQCAQRLKAVAHIPPLPWFTLPTWIARVAMWTMDALRLSGFGSITPMNLRMGTLWWWVQGNVETKYSLEDSYKAFVRRFGGSS